ncbi:hypothetical protein M758_3G225700 [Ceratodon purpureus]|nr:hypothetical protein M758_3G225700 [Ceratodon purpureus]
MNPLQVHPHGNLLEVRSMVGASCGQVGRIFGLDRLIVKRCLREKFHSSGVAGVVARSWSLDLENDVPVKRHGEVSGAGLAVSLLAAILTSCPPALSAELGLNSANAMCSLKGVQANGYEYAYPESWVRDRIRGIEVLAHDPEVTELNMSIFTAPAQSNTLTGSATEVGEAIITQYKKSPTIDKAELLGIDLKQDGGNNRSYSVELSIEAGGKQRHLLTKLIRTDRKVLSLTLQVPEELWSANESCVNSITEKFKQTELM